MNLPTPFYIRVGVSGLLVKRGRVLLGLRHPGDASLPNEWCTPGGGVNYQERLEDALVREFKEETLLDIKVGKIMTVTQRIPSPQKHSILVFYRVYNLNNVGPRIGEDFSDIRWFSRKDFNQPELWPITEQTRKALELYFG